MRELERRLEAAAPYYSFPATPDLAGAVRARLPERPRPRRARGALASAVVLALLAGAVLALSPGARSAVADLLDRIPGIHIERGISLPKVGYNNPPYYGTEVSIDEARARFRRPLRFPAGLGEPDHVYWLNEQPGDMITAVFGGDDRRAELVFSQWKTGGPDLFYKVLGGNTQAEYAAVGSGLGLWIHGHDHGVWYLAPGANTDLHSAHYLAEGHLAGNVLAWRVEDVVFRLEAGVTKQRALELARSLQATAPAPPKPKPRLRGTMDVAVARDGSLVIGDVSDRVFRWRAKKLTVAASIRFPVEVAIDPRGGFAALNNETRIRRVDPRGRVTTLASGLAQVTALAFDADGNVYFSELAGRVRRLDRATGAITTLVGEGLDRPHGLVVVGGTLVVCDTFNNRLVGIDLAGGASRTYATGFDTPVDVESSRDGTLYVADYGNNRIARVVDSRGVTVATGIGANGVAVGAGGTIYATERLLPRVRAINPATGAIRTIVGFP
jgi:sugar lactone lactonase YvrE